jgi:hypothetical protein
LLIIDGVPKEWNDREMKKQVETMWVKCQREEEKRNKRWGEMEDEKDEKMEEQKEQKWIKQFEKLEITKMDQGGYVLGGWAYNVFIEIQKAMKVTKWKFNNKLRIGLPKSVRKDSKRVNLKGLPADITEVELANNLSEIGVHAVEVECFKTYRQESNALVTVLKNAQTVKWGEETQNLLVATVNARVENNLRVRGCFNCLSVDGHIAQDCKNPMKCRKCGKSGHKKETCTAEREQGCCHYCDEKHERKECTKYRRHKNRQFRIRRTEGYVKEGKSFAEAANNKREQQRGEKEEEEQRKKSMEERKKREEEEKKERERFKEEMRNEMKKMKEEMRESMKKEKETMKKDMRNELMEEFRTKINELLEAVRKDMREDREKTKNKGKKRKVGKTSKTAGGGVKRGNEQMEEEEEEVDDDEDDETEEKEEVPTKGVKYSQRMVKELKKLQ